MNANELADELLYRYADESGNFYGDDIHKDVIEILLQQQAKLHKYEQVLHSIANEPIELSHDKIKWQCEDHVRWAKEALK